MSQPAAPASENKAPAKAKQPLVPPDEQFWKHYSPHHEFPLSATSSVVLHGLVLVLVVGIGYLMLRLEDANKALPVDAVAVGGGGGHQQGDDLPPGAPPKEEVTGPAPKPEPMPLPETKPQLPTEPLTPAEVAPPELPKIPDNARLIDPAADVAKRFRELNEDTKKKLMEGLARPAGTGVPKGLGDKGRDGGKDGGKDKGIGKDEGPGTGRIATARQKRVLRWTMMFDTVNGEDYRRQLAAMGAILAVPEPNGDYRVIRNLAKVPVEGKVEDIAEIKRIFWIDDRPESVGPLGQALGLIPPPQRVVAFFPESLEAELLRKELAYRGLKEDQIKETKFRVQRLAGNKFVPVVEYQVPNQFR